MPIGYGCCNCSCKYLQLECYEEFNSNGKSRAASSVASDASLSTDNVELESDLGDEFAATAGGREHFDRGVGEEKGAG